MADQVLLPSGGGQAVAVARVEVPEEVLERRGGRAAFSALGRPPVRGKTRGIPWLWVKPSTNQCSRDINHQIHRENNLMIREPGVQSFDPTAIWDFTLKILYLGILGLYTTPI